MNRINIKEDGKPYLITASEQFLINLALDEYKSLRAEVVSSVDRQYSLANWGISAIAVLTAALINGWDKLWPFPKVMAFIIMFAVPAIVTSYATAWSHVISKISQLGERLHEIEENIAGAINEAYLRTTYRIDPAISIDPFRYLLGWEHKLWHGGTNIRIGSTIQIVKVALAALYVTVIASGGFILMNVKQFPKWFPLVVIGAASIVWGMTWFSLSRYLRISIQ